MESYLTAHISASAIEHNLALLRGLIPPATKLCAVVKADCYGHGLGNLLGLLSRHADWLAVTRSFTAPRVPSMLATAPA